MPRKGIELAVEMVARLLPSEQRPLLITSPRQVMRGTNISRSSLDLAAACATSTCFIQPGRFHPGSRIAGRSPRRPTTWLDGYIAADVITYPSLYEGFGNALIESVYFRKLVVVNRYAVYDADIRAALAFAFIELSPAR